MVSKLDLEPNSAVSKISGIGPVITKQLAKLKIHTVANLLTHYPRKFLDYQQPTPIAELVVGKAYFFQASISKIKTFRTRSGKSITTAIAMDSSGQIPLTWFNNYFVAKTLFEGKNYYLTGKVSNYSGRPTIISPTIEPPDPDSLSTGRLVPIYPLTDGIKSKFLRKIIYKQLKELTIEDPINLKPNLKKALNDIHFPSSEVVHDLADQRLSINHHFLISYQNYLETVGMPPSYSLNIDKRIEKELLDKLPFKLTDTQNEVIQESYLDLTKNKFTHRLIQGETGSGKTMVMLFLAQQAISSKTSVIILCPTKILAQQHYHTFSKYIPNPNLQLVISNGKEKKLNSDNPTVYIGTHGLISQLPDLLKYPVSILFVDEQHRFGVQQREALIARNPTPHLFNLSATPIPRTLALGFFGEVNISTIRNKPKNSKVKTVLTNNDKFTKNINWLNEKVKKGSKVFIVCPSINQQESSQASVIEVFKYYQSHISTSNLWLIHGQMKPDEIASALEKFTKSNTGILVSTSIIEVGIDIPDAEVIIIHSADRFGLASLHQLRGRVGRGDKAGYCILIPTHDTQDSLERLKLLTKYHQGLTLAKFDWKLRGGGELAGHKQHGHLPTNLKHFWDKECYLRAKEIVLDLAENNPQQLAQIAASLQAW